MTAAELIANLRYFTDDMRGPRSAPCTTVVLSGVGVASRDDVPALLDQARAFGVTGLVLHAGLEDLDAFDAVRFAGRVDRIVVPVQPGPGGEVLQQSRRAIHDCQAQGLAVIASTQLSARAVLQLPSVGRILAAAGPEAVVFTFPFPIAGNSAAEVPGVRAIVQALEQVVPVLERAGLRVELKGLPACYLGRLGSRLRRTSNRFYVDADHQCGDALMFFPDVVAFTKAEVCRFCDADGRCDGFFATYLRRSGFPALEPLKGA
jgi:hypothetical protein